MVAADEKAAKPADTMIPDDEIACTCNDKCVCKTKSADGKCPGNEKTGGKDAKK